MYLITFLAFISIISLVGAQTEIKNPYKVSHLKHFTFQIDESQSYRIIEWCHEKCMTLKDIYKEYPIAGIRSWVGKVCYCELEKRLAPIVYS